MFLIIYNFDENFQNIQINIIIKINMGAELAKQQEQLKNLSCSLFCLIV